jgi:hypothetical protein
MLIGSTFSFDLLYLSQFLIQVVMITYWVEGGPMCMKKSHPIRLPDEPEPPVLILEGGSGGSEVN